MITTRAVPRGRTTPGTRGSDVLHDHHRPRRGSR
jgi:hypothetical protein